MNKDQFTVQHSDVVKHTLMGKNICLFAVIQHFSSQNAAFTDNF